MKNLTKNEIRNQLNKDVERFLKNRAVERIRAQKTPKNASEMWRPTIRVPHVSSMINHWSQRSLINQQIITQNERSAPSERFFYQIYESSISLLITATMFDER